MRKFNQWLEDNLQKVEELHPSFVCVNVHTGKIILVHKDGEKFENELEALNSTTIDGYWTFHTNLFCGPLVIPTVIVAEE